MIETVENISTSCQPIGVGRIFSAGWNWYHPAVGHIKGTSGTLDRWAVGYKHTYRPLNGDKEIITIEWQDFACSLEQAESWLNR